ncbi:MAG: hypothetical protein KA314_14365 [Chloroflexi bacterium]|nr:hypothetical protein [Chloroflexota bacterium]MBP8057017.1 hypothetical protein [Chloroflexota bacterium]
MGRKRGRNPRCWPSDGVVERVKVGGTRPQHPKLARLWCRKGGWRGGTRPHTRNWPVYGVGKRKVWGNAAATPKTDPVMGSERGTRPQRFALPALGHWTAKPSSQKNAKA